MSESQTIRFGDICREVRTTTKDNIADGYERYIALEHLDSGSLKIKRWGLIAEDNPSFTRTFKRGQILFGKRRPYLEKAAIAEFDGICSGDIIVMEPEASNEMSSLLPFIIHSRGFWEWAIKTSSGSLSPRTKYKELEKYEFRLSQTYSVESALSVLRKSQFVNEKEFELCETAEQLLEVFITNVMTFGMGSKDNQAKSKYLYHNSDWSVEPLSLLVTNVKRGPSLAANEQRKGIRYLTSGNIQNNKLDLVAEIKYLDNFEQTSQCEIVPDDIIFNCVNSLAQVGKVALVSEAHLDEPMIVGFNNYALEIDPSRLLPKFAYYSMLDRRFAHRVRALVKPAINQVSFASKELNHMLIAFPSVEQQARIVRYLDLMSLTIDASVRSKEAIGLLQSNISSEVGI